jgi:hypothetical protein
MVVLMLVAAACGGGSGGGQQAATATPGAPAALEGVSKELVELLTGGLDVTYKITYRTASPDGEEGDTYVVINKPPRARIDIISADASEPSSVIIGGDSNTETIGCSGSAEQWECSEIEPLAGSLVRAAGPFPFFSAADLQLFDVTESASRTVAGQDARCLRLIRKDQTTGDTEYCLSRDGVPVFIAAPFGTVETTEFSVDVSDQDFTPPAEPQ